jgi:AraC-like DNA-binding protein
MDDPRNRQPHERLCQAWVNIALHTDNPHIGLQTIKYYRLPDLHALGVAFLSSANLLDALNRIIRYEKVFNSELEFFLTEHTDRIDFGSSGLGLEGPALKVTEDSRMSLIIDLCRRGAGGTLDPVEVSFTYEKPAKTGEHFGVFRCPMIFSAPVSRLSFSIEDAQRPFTAANRELAIGNDLILDRMLKSFGKGDLVSRVKQIIVEKLPSGTPSEAAIAKALSTSSRTLSRRLADEQTNYRELVTEVRRELAEQYIADLTIPIAEVSFLLGFSEVSSFSRAFKRWTGKPPHVFRDSLATA